MPGPLTHGYGYGILLLNVHCGAPYMAQPYGEPDPFKDFGNNYCPIK